MIEGWTSENLKIDKFIKDTIYDARKEDNPIFLEWIPFNRFIDIKQIGKGAFSKVYSAIWIDGKSRYSKQNDGNWVKSDSGPMKVALKMIDDSQNISERYLSEVYFNI